MNREKMRAATAKYRRGFRFISVRVTEIEKAMIEKKAADLNLSVSSYLKRRGLSDND